MQFLEILKKFFEMKDNILFAILFGSYARGTYTKHSDIDITIFFRRKPSIDEIIDFIFELSHALNVNESKIDIVVLNDDIPYSLLFEILKYGIPIIVRDKEAFIDFYTRSLNLYYDLKILKETHHLRRKFIAHIEAILNG